MPDEAPRRSRFHEAFSAVWHGRLRVVGIEFGNVDRAGESQLRSPAGELLSPALCGRPADELQSDQIVFRPADVIEERPQKAGAEALSWMHVQHDTPSGCISVGCGLDEPDGRPGPRFLEPSVSLQRLGEFLEGQSLQLVPDGSGVGHDNSRGFRTADAGMAMSSPAFATSQSGPTGMGSP